MTGLDDSRVNTAHSLQLHRALEKNPDTAQNSNLLALRNAGHSMRSPAYQDLIGWQANTVYWSTIYDFLGIKFNPSAAR